MYVFFAHMYVCALGICLMLKAPSALDHLEPEFWMTVSLHVAGGNPGPPQEQQVLIVAESSLQPPSFIFVLFCVVLDYN